jgi:hypothetical protein
MIDSKRLKDIERRTELVASMPGWITQIDALQMLEDLQYLLANIDQNGVL